MQYTRRSVLAMGAGAVTALAGLGILPAHADADKTMAAIKEFAGGAELGSGPLSLNSPEIAENGNTVPISVSVESPMSDDDYVESVALFAEGNPSPEVVVFHFTPLSGEATATTRMRLAKTQNVVAVAKTSKGNIFMAKNEVKVTIGGCGG